MRFLLALALVLAGCGTQALGPDARVFRGTSTLVPTSGMFMSSTVYGATYTVYAGDLKDELVFQDQDTAWSATAMGAVLTFAAGQTFSIASNTQTIQTQTLTGGTGTL